MHRAADSVRVFMLCPVCVQCVYMLLPNDELVLKCSFVGQVTAQSTNRRQSTHSSGIYIGMFMKIRRCEAM